MVVPSSHSREGTSSRLGSLEASTYRGATWELAWPSLQKQLVPSNSEMTASAANPNNCPPRTLCQVKTSLQNEC